MAAAAALVLVLVLRLRLLLLIILFCSVFLCAGGERKGQQGGSRKSSKGKAFLLFIVYRYHTL